MKSSPLKLVDAEEIHGKSWAADVRPGESIQAEVVWQGATTPLREEVAVWRLSPLGVELAPTDESELNVIPIGSKVGIHLNLGGVPCQFDGVSVGRRGVEAGRTILGIRWNESVDASRLDGDERRSRERWICGPEFAPTGMASNPARFNDFIYFRVRDVSAGGMQILLSLRNKFVVPGMVFDATISFPMLGQIRARFKVRHTRVTSEAGKDYLAAGVSMVETSQAYLATVGQFLMQFGADVSPVKLREQGFLPLSVVSGVDFSFVRTAAEYQEVLQLRLGAYASAGKVKSDRKPEQMGDEFDSRARILIGRHRGKVVASMRLMYHSSDDQLEHEQFVALPDDFPAREEAVEITRVCTDPEYRGSD
ncbi:MAG: GNAT family N-acyltransferase, partial [Bdellovibrionota bacterium]